LDFKEEAAKLERFWFKTSNIFIELLLLGFAKPRGSLKSVLAKCTSGSTLIDSIDDVDKLFKFELVAYTVKSGLFVIAV
jgi:hypothetical protein